MASQSERGGPYDPPIRERSVVRPANQREEGRMVSQSERKGPLGQPIRERRAIWSFNRWQGSLHASQKWEGFQYGLVWSLNQQKGDQTSEQPVGTWGHGADFTELFLTPTNQRDASLVSANQGGNGSHVTLLRCGGANQGGKGSHVTLLRCGATFAGNRM